jgi:hypothetical protein
MIDIGFVEVELFKRIAHLLQCLKFERDFESESFFHVEGHEISHPKNLKRIYVICAEPYGPVE